LKFSSVEKNYVVCTVFAKKMHAHFYEGTKMQCKQIFFVRGSHNLFHNRPRARHLRQCDCFGICYILSNHKVLRKYIIFSLLANCLHRPDELALWAGCGLLV